MAQMGRINEIQKMLENDDDDIFLWYALGLEFLALKDLENSKKTFNMVIEKKPDYLPVYYQLAQLLEQLDDEDLAIETYKKGMEIAKQQNEHKTFNELRSALEELEF
jgi:tetratricopeptide (TPR) repeat protein